MYIPTAQEKSEQIFFT
jgi:hypothetical protein